MRNYMSGVVGNKKLCTDLCGKILADKLPHAFIIEGAVGTGKHTIALNVAAALACEASDGDGDFPCGECRSCKKIFGHKCVDIMTVGCDGKATFGVESIRFLREDVHTVPNDLEFKLYIIEDADKMTVQAQNAFLLTLEEPPSFVRFILLCENADLLLETIRSRAPILRTEPVSFEDLDRYISKADRRAAQMKLTSPAEYGELIMSSRHGIGTALSLLDPKAFASVKEMRALAIELADAAASGAGARQIMPLLNRFSSKRAVLSEQLDILSEALTDLILLKKSDSAPLEFFADRETAAQICDKASMTFLYNLGEAIQTAQKNIQRNANVRLTLIKLLSDAKII